MNHCISVNSYFRLWYVSYGGVTDENPNFACFDLLDGDDDTLRLNTLIIRVYAKPHTSTNYTLLIEHDIALCCLQFIGKDVVPSSRSVNISDWTFSSSISDEFDCHSTYRWILYCI